MGINADLPSAYAWCRDMRHAWAPYTVEAATVGSRRGWRQRVRCTRCLTIRTRLLSAAGHVIGGATYAYPDGYLAPPGSGRMTESERDALRLRSLGRPALRVVS